MAKALQKTKTILLCDMKIELMCVARKRFDLNVLSGHVVEDICQASCRFCGNDVRGSGIFVYNIKKGSGETGGGHEGCSLAAIVSLGSSQH